MSTLWNIPEFYMQVLWRWGSSYWVELKIHEMIWVQPGIPVRRQEAYQLQNRVESQFWLVWVCWVEAQKPTKARQEIKRLLQLGTDVMCQLMEDNGLSQCWGLMGQQGEASASLNLGP